MREAAIVSVLAYADYAPERCAHCAGTTCATRPSSCSPAPAPTAPRRPPRPAPTAPYACSPRSRPTSGPGALASGRPDGPTPVFPRHDAKAWTKEDWGNWRERQWAQACAAAGLATAPRPYDLRHSFASLLLAEHCTLHYVAAQLGHSPALTLSTYGHVMAEYADAERIDAEAEIARARGEACSLRVRQTTV